MNSHIILLVIASLAFSSQIRAEEEFTADYEKLIGIEYILSDGDTTVTSIKGWTVGKKDEVEDLVGVIKSKDGGYHSHLIYRLNKQELEGDLTAHELAKHYYGSLVEGTKILWEQQWDKKQIKGVNVARKVIQLEGDGKVEKLWLFVEAKELEDRFYVQIVYHADPVSKEKLDVIGKVMNSVTTKKAKKIR